MTEHSKEALIRDFHKIMVGVYQDALSQYNYRATRFIAMVSKHGGYEAARQLLAAPGMSDGLRELALCGRLDISMEARVLEPPWSTLFSKEELTTARNRLLKLGYRP